MVRAVKNRKNISKEVSGKIPTPVMPSKYFMNFMSIILIS